MLLVRELWRRSGAIVIPVFGIAMAGFFAYNLVEGNRGFLAWVHLTRAMHQARTQLAEVESRRDALELKVSHLRSDHVDRDLLDEEARAALNVAAPNDIVIMRPTAPASGGATPVNPLPQPLHPQ
jgi:cell division protein FtsB